MKKNYLLLGAMLCLNTMAQAQKIDFDFAGRSNVTADDYTAWVVNQGASSTLTVDDVTFTLTASGAANGFRSQWSKNDVTATGLKLTGDAAVAFYIDDDNNTPNITDQSVTAVLTISGLTAGRHTLQAYHNGVNGYSNIAPISVSVNGTIVINSLAQSENAQTLDAAALSYITFTANEGEDVVVEYTSLVESSTTYGSTLVYLNALQLDGVNTSTQAQAPNPETGDYHAECNDDNNTEITLSWKAADDATSHNVYLGTSADELSLVAQTADTSYVAKELSNLNTYYWRIDEVNASGNVTEGEVWTFRPRHLAFPGAEGWGKWAIGGRGGTVYHVTTLEDNGDDDNPIEGSFRYGIKKATGPRTIVFDVAGVISLKSRLMCSDSYVTIAGQTAPGNGILIRTAPMSFTDDGIVRFLRMRLGHKKLVNGVIPGDDNGLSYGDEADTTEETTLSGLDGMGLPGANNAIMDHCSISWTIDEGFSSRNAKSITLQRTLISEALNQAGHPNYSSGTRHGYAATIGGGEMSTTLSVGSFHHNLLAHNEGRNWSISGGLDGTGYYDGHHDIFNNVVYDWRGRASDGGTHELNFVNNFYKMGASTTQTYLLRHQFEGTGNGTQAAYVSGNIRQAKNNGSLTNDAEGTTYCYELSNGQVLDREPWVREPFIESLEDIETAQAAYKNVLSDVGANQPFFDPHDTRMVTETIAATSTTKGSNSGITGQIDSEEDDGCEGFDGLEMIEASRPEGFDTDQDGMPDWYETAISSSTTIANNNDDPDGDGYTLLEDYLNYMAEPHFDGDVAIDLQQYFAGYTNSPSYSVESTTGNASVSLESGLLNVSYQDGASQLTSVTVNVTDADNWGSMQRTFHVYFSEGTPTGVKAITEADSNSLAADGKSYDLAGRQTNDSAKGVIIKNGKKSIRK